MAFARTDSTYPTHNTGRRDGDPVADHYCYQYLRDGTSIFAMADGCGFGNRPKTAAKKITITFVEFLTLNLSTCETIDQLGNLLMETIETTHLSSFEDPKGKWYFSIIKNNIFIFSYYLFYIFIFLYFLIEFNLFRHLC